MHLRRLFALAGVSLPLWAQYAGPAILTRGEQPAAMAGSQISFRPFIELTGIYDTGLSGVLLKDASGDLANASAYGVQLAGGISGAHRWRHTILGLDYRGTVQHYSRQTYYDSTNQSLLFGLTHQFTRHITFRIRESAGLFSRDFGLLGLPQTVPFDPFTSYIPRTDFFDNRTLYLSTQADVTIQKSTRLSFDIGGDWFLTRRRSTALFGVKGNSARGDVQYRISRRSTVGIAYNYTHFSFTGIFSGTDFQGLTATYAVMLTRNLEFSGYAGGLRLETKFERLAAVDPIIQAILGITAAPVVFHDVVTRPTFGARISRTFRRGVAYVSGGYAVTPGNGLFLTSFATHIDGGYTYTGLRRWSFNSSIGYRRSKSFGNIVGQYSSTSGTISLSRQLQRSFHFVFSLDARQYSSPDYSRYNRLVYGARIGFGFSPGNVPLRIW